MLRASGLAPAGAPRGTTAAEPAASQGVRTGSGGATASSTQGSHPTQDGLRETAMKTDERQPQGLAAQESRASRTFPRGA